MKIKNLFKYRNVWMGLAMIWIVFYHTNISCTGVVRTIKVIGYGGVDIFLFSSGIGNYYSYIKDKNPVSFIKRRIRRLAPVYLPFITIWLIYQIIHNSIPFKYIIGNLFAVQ